MEADPLLDDREAFNCRLHLCHVGGVILWRLPPEWEPNATVVDANLVADLTPEQLEHGKAGGLAGYVPKRHFDCADRAAPGFEAAQAPDLQHSPFDVGGAFAQKVLLVPAHHTSHACLSRLPL